MRSAQDDRVGGYRWRLANLCGPGLDCEWREKARIRIGFSLIRVDLG
jgi:hypothetical protein